MKITTYIFIATLLIFKIANTNSDLLPQEVLGVKSGFGIMYRNMPPGLQYPSPNWDSSMGLCPPIDSSASMHF